MRDIRISVLTVLSALMLAGCVNDSDLLPEDVGGGTVTFNLSSGGFDTKSSFGWGEKEIRSAQIVVTDDQDVVLEDLWSATGTAMTFKGVAGKRYYAYAAVNLGARIAVSSLSDFTSGSRTVTSGGIASTGIPMFSEGGVEFTVGGGSVTVPLVRMLARVDFKVRTDNLEGDFTVKSVKIYNPVTSFVPFGEGTATANAAFDSASASDIASLNAGGVVTLYAFENLRGDLLSGNTDPWAKVPASLGDGADKCTYIEMTASYDNQGVSSDDITYRMYLGVNNTTNFDVVRNTAYTLTVFPSDEEINGHRGSWKVESSGWQDSRSLVFDRHEVTMFALSTDGVNILRNPLDLEYEFSSEVGDDCGLTVTRTGDVVSLVSTVDLAEQRTATLHIQTKDGVKYDDCTVIVRPRVVLSRIALDPEESIIYVGGTQVYKVWGVYSDDSVVDITNSEGLVIMSLDAGKATVDGCIATGVADGDVTIKAAFEGKEATASLTVRDVVTWEYSLVASSTASEIDVAGTATFSAVLMKQEVRNGVPYGVPVSVAGGYTVTWSAEPSDVISFAGNIGTGLKDGTAVVTGSCTYVDGDGISHDVTSNELQVRVSDVITYEYELVVSASPESISIGGTTGLAAVLTEYKVVNGHRNGESEVITGVSPVWSSATPSVLSIDGAVGTGLAEGTSVVTCSVEYDGQTIDSVSGVTVTVNNGVDHEEIIWGNVMFVLTGCGDIPASGGDSGNCPVSNVRQVRTIRTWYLDGTHEDGVPETVSLAPGGYVVTYGTSPGGEYTAGCPSIHAGSLGTTVKDRSQVGTVYAKVSANGKTAVESVSVYQQRNRLESHVEQSRIPDAKQYGSWTVTGYYYDTKDYWVDIDADLYTSSSSPAPASGGSATLSWSAGHTERLITNLARSWTQTATVVYLDTYTSMATVNIYDTVDYDSGTETMSETGDWHPVSNTPTISGSSSWASRNGTSVTMASEGTTTYSSGRSVTYTARNGSVTDVVTLFQEPNVVEQTIVAYYEYRDLVLEAETTAFEAEGGRSYLDVYAYRRRISSKTVYTSGSYTGGTEGSWSTNLYHLSDNYTYSKLTGDNGLTFDFSIVDKAIISENTGAARSWTIQASYNDDHNSLVSNVVTITQSESEDEYEIIVN